MNWKHANEPVRCDLCRRAVDRDTRERARWAFQPLVICDSCVREADTRFSAGHSWTPVAA
ncbi:MAG TPA: hypothetical protein VH741_00225 [Candidatus Limnocylindrales bacterium]|jgi:hypothetical protein